MESVFDHKTQSDACNGNPAQERAYNELRGSTSGTGGTAPSERTCIGCGARVASGEELTCGH